MDTLQRSGQQYKLFFLYLHPPDHQDTPVFCENCLYNDVFVTFLNENFVAWGGSVKASEGFKMRNSLKASRFPFCAVVMAAIDKRIALLQQGAKSPEEMVTILQRLLEEVAHVLVSARLEAEERRNSMRLREEHDSAYQAALEADQAMERRKKEEKERLEHEAAEAESKMKEDEIACAKALQKAAEKEAALAKMREEKSSSLGAELEKGPDVQIVNFSFGDETIGFCLRCDG